MTRRRGWLLALLIVVTVGVGEFAASRDRNADCPVVAARAAAQPLHQLVPVGELLPVGSVGAGRRPVVEGVGGLGGPLGPVLGGRFYESERQVPALVPLGEDVVFAVAGPRSLTLREVSLPDGRTGWTRHFGVPVSSAALVADDFVVLAGGPEPAVVSLDVQDGTQVGCVPVPTAGVAVPPVMLVTDQAGGDVVVAAAGQGAAVTLSRITPREGVVWKRPLAEVLEAGAVTVAGASVVLSRVSADPVRLAEVATAGGIPSPMVTAYSLEDGSPSWTYPNPDDDASTVAATVIGSDDRTGIVHLLTATAAGTDPARARASLVALDEAGQELWRHSLGRGSWDGSLWGSVPVVEGPDPRGGAVLKAFTSEGPRWTLRSGDVGALGRRFREGFGPAVEVGGRFLVPAPSGLVAVDAVTGDVERLGSEVAVDEVLPLGDTALVRSGEALLVVGVRP